MNPNPNPNPSQAKFSLAITGSGLPRGVSSQFPVRNEHQFGRAGGGGAGSNAAALPPPSLSQRLSVRTHAATLPNTSTTAPTAPASFATGSATGSAPVAPSPRLADGGSRPTASAPRHPSTTHRPSARANTSSSYHYSKPPKLSPVALAARLAATAAAAAARPLRPVSSAHARHMAKMAQAAHGNHAAPRDRERDAHSRAALAQAQAPPEPSGTPAGGKAHSGPARPVKPKADLRAAARTAVSAAAVGAAAAAAAAAESNECRLMQRAHQVFVGLSWGTLPPAQQERWTQIHCDRRLRPSQGGASSSMQGGAG